MAPEDAQGRIVTFVALVASPVKLVIVVANAECHGEKRNEKRKQCH